MYKGKGSEVLEGSRHSFAVNQSSWVIAKDDRSGGTIESQSVEVLLLYEILRTLQRINYQSGIG